MVDPDVLARVLEIIDEDRERELAILRNIVGSEAFMWLMVGANHPDAHCQALRPAWDAWKDEFSRSPYAKPRAVEDHPDGQ